MTFPEDAPIPEAWVRIEMRRSDYLDLTSTIERVWGALEMIGRWNGDIKPFITDPRKDFERLVLGVDTMETRLTMIDAPPPLPVMVEWELHRRVGIHADGVAMWEKLQAGSCEESKLGELSPISIEHGHTYRITLLDDEGEIRIIHREFTV